MRKGDGQCCAADNRPKLTDRAAVLSTTTLFNITGLIHDKYDYIINLHRLNDIRNLNNFIEAVNEQA